MAFYLQPPPRVAGNPVLERWLEDLWRFVGANQSTTPLFPTLFDANSILKADTANTPVALTVAASTLIGRAASGGIDDLSPAQGRTVLGLGALATGDDASDVPLDFTPSGHLTGDTTVSEGLQTVDALTLGLGTADYSSGEQTVATDTLLTLAHGIGAIPTIIFVRLRCTTGDVGYTAGEEIFIKASDVDVTDRGFICSVDATNIYITQGSNISILNKSTFNIANITTSSWRWVVYAWQ